MAVCESLVLSQGDSVLPYAQSEPHLEVHLAAGPSVEAVPRLPQPLTRLLLVSLMLLIHQEY